MLEVLLWPALAHVLPALLLAATGGTVSVSDSQKLSTCEASNTMAAQRALWVVASVNSTCCQALLSSIASARMQYATARPEAFPRLCPRQALTHNH